MTTTTLFIIAATAICGYMFRNSIQEKLTAFENKYRLKDDIHHFTLLGQFFNHYIIQCQITKRFSLWYEFEKNALAKNGDKKIAIKYARPVPGLDFKTYGEKAFEVESLTYKELYNAVLRMSAILHYDYNIKKGDFVPLYFSNKPLFVIIWMALWNLNAIPTFINCNLTSSPLVHCIKVGNFNMILVDDECLDTFNETKDQISAELPNLSINIIEEKTIMDKITDPLHPIYREQDKVKDAGAKYYDPAVLVYTSGTSGLPKSAVNSWRKVWAATHLFPRPFRMDTDSNIFTAMPLYHGTASILGVLPALIIGGTISIGHKFSLSSYWTQVKICDANTIQYVGEVCRYLVGSKETLNEKECYGKIRLAFGNGLRPDIWMKLKERFGIPAIGEFYASSESPFATTCYETNGIGLGAIRNNGFLTSAFLSLQYTLVAMDPEDESVIYRDPKTGLCRKPKVDEKGEMVMRILNPKNVKATFPGYINDDVATYSKIIRDVFRKGDAFVRSDDLMKFDELGCLYFVDRLGDTYRWKSENVSSTEVENQLMKAIPQIKTCVVVGAKVDNHEGRAGYLLVQTVNNNTESDIEKKNIMDQIYQVGLKHLPHYARPVFVTFQTIELSHNHKISKKLFRDPILPNGKNGNLIVYYIDSKVKGYSLLDSKTYSNISSGKLRI